MTARALIAEPLTAAAFAPWGDVLDAREASSFPINRGLTTRFHALTQCEANAPLIVNLFRSRPASLPLRVHRLEQHPYGSQAFYPINGARFLVLVAPPGESVDASELRLFVTDGRQGVNYKPGAWHHYHLVLEEESDFLVVDRVRPADNLIEVKVRGEAVIEPF